MDNFTGRIVISTTLKISGEDPSELVHHLTDKLKEMTDRSQIPDGVQVQVEYYPTSRAA